MNAHLDTVQAVILAANLEVYPEELKARQGVAALYDALLTNYTTKPALRHQATSVWAQYTIRSRERDALKARLAAAGIPTAIYYSRPLHRQTAYRDFPVADGGCPNSELAAAEVLSLPMHPYLAAVVQEEIAAAICAAPTMATG
jgi:dTDP-4-amino-4,6-dideoxygalactose transaminase